MHLTQVHMENFKSFGRKLTVPFEPGFTGITGPNGSGKSNIGDAILFVLGPNSPRAIRAGRLTDLIFNGGQSGKPAGYTLVSLTFDNEDRTMPIDEDEVVLTRKVKRAPKKGDKDAYNSYFYVNGRASKKREFVDLLNHARISADGYNITQQGDVLNICRMSNVERRKILDDIAGVTAFDKDIDAADKRRLEVEENLERIGIVLEEIERTMKQLDKERGAAEKYKQLTADIHETKGLMAWRRKEDLESEIAQIQEQIGKYTGQRSDLEQKHRDLEDKLKDAQARFAELEQKIREEGGEEVEKLQDQVAEARDKRVRLEEKIHFVKEELHGGDEELLPLRKELARIEKELKNTRKLEAEATEAFESTSKDLDQKRKELEALRERISQSDEGAMAINRELGKLKKEHEDKRIELHDKRLAFDRSRDKLDALQRNVDTLQDDHDTLQTDRKEVDFELKELQQQTDGSGKKQKETERRLFELRKAQAELTQESEDLENRIRRLHREYSELSAQEAAAARVQGNAPRATAEVLKARDDGAIKGIIGTISELADADEEYQTALETAAGMNMHAVVVEDDGVAAQCIEMVKKTRAGRVKVLPLNKMVPGRPRGQALMKAKKEGCLGFAIDLIDFDDRYRNAFWNVFGDTLVVGSMDAGRRLMGGVRMVTLEGEQFEAGGAMIGGSQSKKKGPSFTGSDRGRMDQLLRDIQKAEEGQEQALERIASVKREMAELQEQLDSHGRSGQNVEDRLKGLEKRSSKLEERDQALTKELEDAQAKLAKEEEASSDIKARMEELETRLEELESLREEKSQLLLKGSKKEWRQKMEELDKAVRDLYEASVDAEKRKDVAAKQAELVEERRDEMAQRIDGHGSGRAKLEEQLADLEAKHEKADAEVEALMKMERKATASLGGLRDKKDAVHEEITDLRVKMEKVSDRMETHYGLILNLKSKLPAIEETLGEAKIELKEFPVEVAADQDVPAYDDLKRQRRNLERQLDNLGPVNQRALEEYDAQAERKTELDSEVERLHTQRDELEKLVAEITQKKKDAFMEVFVAVNENFADVYAGLSMGGKALMELEDPKGIFEGGLILKAQPMGKRVTRLDALSGGEKSLTSMAFIFAIQRFDPSPFYYFDEVDQNLDAVNSELLARMIRDNAQFAQFIVVSLRKITLKEARHLYGVTQQTPGQSEVIANFALEDVKEEDRDGEDGDDDGPDEGGDGDGPNGGLEDSIKGMISVEVRE